MPQPRQRQRPAPPPPTERPDLKAPPASAILDPAAAATRTAAAASLIVPKLIASMAKFGAVKRDEDAALLLGLLKARFPDRPPRELEKVVDDELLYEQEYQRKMLDRLKRDLPKTMEIADEKVRADRMAQIRAREARWLEARHQSMTERAIASESRTLLHEISPEGAYWKLGDNVKQHTLDCVAMAGHFWPWSVIDRVHPLMHHGCACELFGLDEAIERGFMSRGDQRHPDDAVAHVRRLAQRIPEISEKLTEAEIQYLCATLVEGQSWDHRLHPKDRLGRWMDKPGVEPLVALAGRSVDMEGDWEKNPAAHDLAQRQIGELLARYAIPFKGIQVRDGVSEFNQYAGKSKDRIYLSHAFLDDADAARRAKEFKGITVHGGDRAGTIVHEFGHILDGHLLSEDTKWYRAVLEPWLNAPITYDVGGKPVTAPRWQAGIGSEAISPYAGESRFEYVAEAFTDWWLHGEDAHPRSQELGQMFDARMRERKQLREAVAYREGLHLRDRRGRWVDMPETQGAEAFGGVFGGFKHGGLEVHLTRVDFNPFRRDAVFSVEFDIRTAGSEHAGSGERQIIKRPNGKFAVQHASLFLEEEYQGKGFAAALQKHAEAGYRQLGFEGIATSTAEVGGYAWARAGFDFDDERIPRQWQHESLVGIRNESADPPWKDLLPESAMKSAMALEDALLDESNLMSAIEVAGWGREDAWWIVEEDLDVDGEGDVIVPAGERLWPGKLFMLGNAWHGYKKLDGLLEALTSHDASNAFETVTMGVPPDYCFGDQDETFWRMMDGIISARSAGATRMVEAGLYTERLHPRNRLGRYRKLIGEKGLFALGGEGVKIKAPHETGKDAYTFSGPGGKVDVQRGGEDFLDRVAAAADEVNAPDVVAASDLPRQMEFAQVFDGFTFAGLTAKVEHVDVEPSKGRVFVKGRVVDDDGRQQGKFRRELLADDSVYHASLKLNAKMQGAGFGTAFVRESEREYASRGYPQVRVTAGDDLGGYVWAREGFGFVERFHPDPAINGPLWALRLLREKRSDDWHASDVVNDAPVSDELKREFLARFPSGDAANGAVMRHSDRPGYEADLAERAAQEFPGDVFRTPQDIAAFGRGETWEQGGRTWWLGKWFMAGAQWDGVRDVRS